MTTQQYEVTEMTQDKSRAAFEGWYKFDSENNLGDIYARTWRAWQASRAALLNELQGGEMVSTAAKGLADIQNGFSDQDIAKAVINAITTKLGVSDGE